jgi:pyrroline-5-carboxylate reductase
LALKLAAQTCLGAAKMVLDTGEHPAVLKDRVASPGGTTIVGLSALEEGRVRWSLIRAVELAAQRSREIGS